MHEMSVYWLRVAALLYAVGLLHAIVTVLRGRVEIFRVALAAFVVAFVLHFVSLVEMSLALGHLPLNNFFESVSLCAFLIAALFLFVYWRYDFASLSVFLFPLVFLMTMVGSMEIPVATWTNRGVRDAWLLLHVLLVLSGFAALLLTAAASVVYLIQERHLKTKRPRTGMLDRLPPLGTLDDLITKSMNFGFVFITLAVIAASTWAFIESGTRWIGDAKIAISMLTWGFYLLMVFLRMTAGWRGRKAAIMAITALGCSALTWAAHIGLRPLLIK
ncbi:MAG: cytochrome c biogenesis protein CcsA [Bryobacteraceae bacterium]